MWKNFSKENLDKAYNNSLAVANSAEIVRSWVQSSISAKEKLPGDCDISYGDTKFQSFDFFSAGDNAPVIVFLHGGFWQMRSKDDFTFVAPPLVQAGFSVAMLGYRLAPYANMHEIVRDVRDGLKAIGVYMNKNQMVPQGLWLIGWSAGAHLISMVQDEECVLGGTAISGIYDLEPMRHCYINEKLALDEGTSLKNSPILLQQNTSKPLDIFVGGSELPEMQRQSVDFSVYRNSTEAEGSFKTIPEKNHYTILDELTDKNGEIFKVLVSRLI
ncbi:alpha/beta hydrolase [Polynucleobacter sp. JS-JIR-II-b4]|uniref:alpha/beta hydrolase n=1 Tax=Polynucleobacter sp. JS-JIR-II-b4 TaxID=1758390 RepID=UPI001BFDD5B6|nr:alpha/beta hydrolase [Polynucleobacter sp. JS-JIR-II-b4]QWE01965.1 alpha/beta hydrolase [Polynucleobacter sp. JS-JIR-II-b4]